MNVVFYFFENINFLTLYIPTRLYPTLSRFPLLKRVKYILES